MLHVLVRHLQPTGIAYSWVRNITIPTNLIRCVNNHHTLLVIISQHSGYFSAQQDKSMLNLVHAGTLEHEHL